MLRTLRKGGWAVFWTVAALVLGPPILLGLMLLAGAVMNVDMVIDLERVLYAVAATIVAIALALWVRGRMQPKTTVSVGYSYRLIQPTTPLGRYRFDLEVFYEIEEKGEHRRIDQGRIELVFKRKDHPELISWTEMQIGIRLEEHRRQAEERYPDAQVIVSEPVAPGKPVPLPELRRPELAEPRKRPEERA